MALLVGVVVAIGAAELTTRVLLLPTVVALVLVFVPRVWPAAATVAVVLAAGVLVGVPAAGTQGLLAVGLFVAVYATTTTLFRAVRERLTAGGPVEVCAWIAAMALPAGIHRGLEALAGLPHMGVPPAQELDWGAVVRGDLLGLVGLAPIVVAVVRSRHREVDATAWTGAAGLALVAVGTVLVGRTSTDLVVLVGVAPVVAALWLGRAPTMAVSAVVVAAVGVLGVAPGTDLVALQRMTTVTVAAATVLAALRSPASVPDPVDGVQPIALAGTGATLYGIAGTRHQLVVFVRRLRTFNAVVLVLLVGAALAGVWQLEPGLPLWAVAIGAVLPVLGVNALSHHLDRSRGMTDTRELLEVLGDTAALVVMTVPVAAFASGVTLYTSMLWVTTMAVLRLAPARAAVVAGGYALLATGVALADVAPIAIAPDLPWLVLLITAAAPLLPGLAAGWLVSVQRDAQSRAESSAVELDELQQQLARAEAATRIEQRRAEATADSRGRVIEQLRAANEELERSRQGLERFADIVAHDLRGPLTTAHMALQAEDDLPPGQGRGMAMRGIHRAVDLLESIYDHAQVATTPLSLARTDLSTVVEGAVFDVHERAMESGAMLAVSDEYPAAICDPVLVGQVLMNLLGNAIRHAGHDRRATVHVTARREADAVVVTVADDGPGLPDDSRDLFDAGVQGRMPTAASGLGLGLATCRDIVARHGGRIWAGTSELGGAAFSFELPDRHPGVTAVLVVEDDDALRAVYATALRGDDRGAVVLEAPDLATAREVLGDHGATIDAVLLDVMLPDGRGDELLEELADLGVPTHVVTDLRPDAVPAAIREARVPVTAKQDIVLLRGRELRDRLLAG